MHSVPYTVGQPASELVLQSLTNDIADQLNTVLKRLHLEFDCHWKLNTSPCSTLETFELAIWPSMRTQVASITPFIEQVAQELGRLGIPFWANTESLTVRFIDDGVPLIANPFGRDLNEDGTLS